MKTLLTCIGLTVAVAGMGCSGGSSGPVTVTAEMEAAQKKADQEVKDAETTRQKTQKLTGNIKVSAEDEEAARARRGQR